MAVARTYKAGRTAALLSPRANNIFNNQPTLANQSKVVTQAATEEEKNKGGPLGGVGYFFEKLGVGTMQSIEGIWDYTAGGIAKLAGKDDWAEKQFANNWFGDWYSHPEEWYNPGETMQFVGDIAGGIGSSLPSIGASFIPGVGAAVSIVSAALGAAGNATSEAYRESGELTGKEFGYGALSGATEGIIEKVTAGIGVGTGRIIKNATKKSAKEVTESISKTMLKKVGGLGLDFASEAFEEGFAEFISPYYQRFTYNPDAENATAEEILYAAIVGGFSGLITSGAESGIRTVFNVRRGNKLDTVGRTQGVIELSERLAAYEDENKTGDSTYEKISKTVKALKSSLEKTDGKIMTVHQKNMLATLEANNTLAPVKPLILRSAANVVADAEGYARRFNEAQYTDENGNKLQYTAEDILKDVDVNNPRSLSRALETNKVLRDIAVSQATGKILINARNYAAQVMSSEQQFANDYDLTRFVEGAPAEVLNSVSSALGIEDWNNVTLQDVNSKLSEYKSSEAYRTAKSRADAFNAAKDSPAKKNIPLRPNFAEGVSRYNDGKANIGILKENGTRIIHDYDAGTTTRPLSYNEATEVLKAYTAAEQSSTRAAKAENVTDNQATTENYKKRLDAWDKTTEGFSFVLGDVSSAISNLEMDGKKVGNKQVRIDATKVKNILSKHENMTIDVIKQLPNVINDPIVILDSNSVKGRLVVFGEVYDAVGRIVLVSLELKPTTRSGKSSYMDIIKIASAYGKRNIQNLLDSSNIRYVNENKSRVNDWLKVNRLQLPLPNAQSNSATTSIPNSTQKVNSSAEENSSSVNKYAEAAKEADALAKEKIKDYPALSAEDKAKVRRVIRQAKANGFSESDTLLLARVSAHSRLDIEINEQACTREQKQEDGTTKVETVDGLYDIKTKKIYINPKAKRSSVRIIGHEAFHAIYDALIKVKGGEKILTKAVRAAANRLDKIKTNTVGEDGKKLTKAEKIAKAYRNESVVVIFEEYAAHYAEYFTDKAFMSSLVGEKPSIKEKILSFFTKAEADYADDSRLSLAARRYKNLYKKMFAALSQVNKYDLTSINQKKMQVTGDNDEGTRGTDNKTDKRFALPVGEEIVDARTVTEEDVRTLLDNAFNKQYRDGSYIPVRVNTPSILIEAAQSLGKTIDDLPIILNVGKARQMMSSQREWALEQKRGTAHDFTVDDVISLIKAMDDPKQIIYQSADERYVEVVEFETAEKTKAVAVLEIGENKNPEYLNGYNGGFYQVLVTAFETDTGYVETLLGKDGNIRIYPKKKKGSSQRGSGNKVPSHLNESPFANSIPETEQKSNPSDENSSKNSSGSTTRAAKNLDEIDVSLYNEIQLGYDEQKRIQSEALTWDAKHRNELRTRTLSNEITYRYVIDNDGIVHVFDKYAAKNIHEWKNDYGNTSSTRPNSIVKELRSGYGNNSINGSSLQNGREPGENDRPYNSSVRRKGRGDGAGYSKDRSVAHRKQKAVSYKFDQDGSGHGIVTYSDGSTKRFAKPLEDTSIGYISTAYSKQEYDGLREVVNSAKKATVRGASSFIQQMQVLFVNEQAGIEKAGKKLGIEDIEAKVEQMRVARNKAQTMLGDVQYITVNGKWEKVGKGFARIWEPIKDKGATYCNNFQMLLFHRHNIDRMSLEERSIKKNNDRIAEVERLKKRNEEIELDLTVCNGVLNAYKYKRSAEAYAQRQKANDEIKALKAEQRANKHAINSLTAQIEHFVPEENKPVFGKEVNGEMKPITAEESRAEVARLLQEHPEFEGYAKEIHDFLDNLMKQNVAAGRVSESLYLELKDKYPNYVPTMRELQNQGNKGVSGKFNIKVKGAVRGAKGGFSELQPLDISIPRMVEEVMNACAANDVAKALGRAAQKAGANDFVSVESKKKMNAEAALSVAEGSKDDAGQAPANQKANQITYYENGEQVTLNVTKDIFAGFDAFNSKAYENVLPVVAATKVNNLFKKLVTSANPFFLVRNALRDIQDAGINTKYGTKFVKNYFKAMKLISTNSEYWQLYRAAGGLNSSVFEYDKGYTGRVTKRGLSASENKVLSFFGSVERANVIIEQLPRFAEFVSSIEAGNSVEQAVLDAADVTTNFGRTGKVTKILNKTAFPFLNPAIQGLSKIWRNIAPILDFSHPRIAVKALLSLAVKAAIVGIIPQLLNQLLLGDDEEYQELRDSDKENNYIFRTGDTFFKLPKGRVAAVLAGLTNRTVQEINGQSADWKDYLDSVISNVTPVENFSRSIIAPFRDVKNNTTWYGSKIEGQQFENTRPEDRYDENTSSIAIGIGKAFGWSPKKVHYVIDQYSGVIGDFILPLTTQKAERNIISTNFVIDPVSSNKLSDDFYKLYEEAQYLKTDGDIAALYKVKYLNSVKSAVGQMYDEKAAVQRSELSNGEKLQKTRVIQALINEAYRNAVNGYEAYSGAIAETQGYFDDSTEQGQKLRYTEITRLNFGAERALKEYNADVYSKAQSLYKAGIDYDTYYSYYFATKDLTSDKDENGKTVSGSKRAKVLSAINALGISTEKKLLLLCSRGYSIKDGDFGIKNIETAKKRLLRYILSLPLTRVQKAELAESCGFTVNGYKISLK